MFKGRVFRDYCTPTNQQVKDMKAAIRAVRFVLMIPLSSTEVERTFSVIKAVGNPRRAMLKP
jgi:hypothetical protein